MKRDFGSIRTRDSFGNLMTMEDKLKRLNDLYKLLLSLYINDGDAKNHGICFAIMDLYKVDLINHSEFFDLKTHFKNNKPSEYNHKEFFDHKSYVGTSVWWNYGDESVEQRKLFLNKMILITNPKKQCLI